MNAFAATPVRRWLIVLGVLVYACLLQGVRPLYSPDEGRYTNVAVAMLDDGDWLHPMLHHEVEHWSKPPLTYWGIAASVAVLGRHEFAARLPSALAFACAILLIGRLGRRFVPDAPWLPALVYATLLLPSLAANLVTTDSLLALWETLEAVAFVEMWWASTPRGARRARCLLGLAAALAFMTKGPPGLLTLGACFAFAAWSEGWRGLRRAFGWDALAIFLIVGGAWYAIVAIEEPAVMRYFLVEEVVNRVASDKLHRNGEWYGALKVYLPTLLIGSLPWLPFVLAAAWRRRRDALAHLRGNDSARFLVCWLLLPLLVFALARSRLPLYLLPLFAPLALIGARYLASQGWHRRRWGAGAVALCGAVLVGARALPVVLGLDVADDDRRLADAVRAVFVPLPDEIAFVDDAPRFGLRFYLGSEIERIDLPDLPVAPQSEELAEELDDDEGCRLYLTAPDNAADLERNLTAHKAAYRRVAEIRGYAAVAQLSQDCAWRADALPASPAASSP